MLEPGIIGNYSEAVTTEKTAKHYGSGCVEVFATPAMIAGMEKTCMDSVQPFLGSGETTVGTLVHAEHIKATPLGETVSYRSELTEVNGREMKFTVEAFDKTGMIGKGSHSRFIINIEKFMSKLPK